MPGEKATRSRRRDREIRFETVLAGRRQNHLLEYVFINFLKFAGPSTDSSTDYTSVSVCMVS